MVEKPTRFALGELAMGGEELRRFPDWKSLLFVFVNLELLIEECWNRFRRLTDDESD